ncbi:MAG: hypothetical protein OXH70_07775 [Acidobacteria bacterium]|nr:hypothetical protein [Acidobacteriota bacterium]
MERATLAGLGREVGEDQEQVAQVLAVVGYAEAGEDTGLGGDWNAGGEGG